MNRLQKKCVIATVGIHLLLLTLLLVGPAFFNPKPKETDTHLLHVIPANLVDAVLNSGVPNAVPPAPQPPAPQPQIQPQPPAPQPEPERTPPKPIVTPAPVPTPEKIEKPVKHTEPKPEPKPAPKLNASDLKRVTRRETKNSTASRDDSRQQARALNNVLKTLKTGLSGATEINLSGNSSAAYANYGDVVISKYHFAWVPPDGMDNDKVTVQFKVTIAKDGTVVSAHIVTPSGDAKVNAAVQRMLERVQFIAPFPEGTKENERDYTINFNATRITQ
ncbi:MAG TPA: TonB family protein [Verrucomicrobiae bacterium]|nr:TonB family protein [Verrucomicrobiae bacterium]